MLNPYFALTTAATTTTIEGKQYRCSAKSKKKMAILRKGILLIVAKKYTIVPRISMHNMLLKILNYLQFKHGIKASFQHHYYYHEK